MLRFVTLPGLAGALLAALLVASPADGSIVQALELDELVDQSDRIFVGTVVFSESFWLPNGTIGTWHRIEVESDVEGNATDEREVIVETLGGELGELGMRVEGEPSFSVGERVLVFTHGGGPYTASRPVGMGQGVMRIRDERGLQMVRQSRDGMLLMRRNAQGRLVKSRGALPEPERLDAFLTRLRTLVDARRGAQ